MTKTNTAANGVKKKGEINKMEESPPFKEKGGIKDDTVSYHSPLLLKVPMTFDCLQEKS